MVLQKEFIEGKNIFNQVWYKVRNRKFSGNSGIAIKNSAYNFLVTLSLKFGSLIFTMIMARLLLPELFGLYSLALSTILIFGTFSELSINETLVRFVSKALGLGKKEKARAYIDHFVKIKIIVTSLVILALLLSAKFISKDYYHKPIYLALLAGCLYLVFAAVAVVFQSILQAMNNFKPLFYREIIVQILKIIIVPLLVLWALKNSLDNEHILFLIILGLAFTYLVASVSLYIFTKRTGIISGPKSFLSKSSKKTVNKFILVSSATLFSGVFFGYIDIVMLGYFVSSEYIGYYQAAFSFISAILPLITFSTALLPVFSRLDKKRLETAFEKSMIVVSVVSLFFLLALFLFSKEIILLVFGKEYLASIGLIKLFSLLLITSPIVTIYSTYFSSIGKPGIVTKSLISSTIINIILTYILISSFIKHSQTLALYGAVIAAIISRFYYAAVLLIERRRLNKKNGKK